MGPNFEEEGQNRKMRLAKAFEYDERGDEGKHLNRMRSGNSEMKNQFRSGRFALRRCNSKSGSSSSSLPKVSIKMDDVVQEILVRLPAKSLVRCRSLSKEWNHFITRNKSFRLNYLKRNNDISFMLGFYLVKTINYKIPEQIHFLPTSIEGKSMLKKRKTDDDDDSPLEIDKSLKKKKTEDETMSGFNPPALPLDESLSFLSPSLTDIRVLGSSNGFLLCTLDKERCPMSYIICNPTNKKWFSLPRANLSGRSFTHGFICRSESPGIGTAGYYKVVRSINPPDSRIEETITMEVISSDEPEWKLLHLTCPSLFYLDCSTPLRIIISEMGGVYFRGLLLKLDAAHLQEYNCLSQIDNKFIRRGVIVFHDKRKQSVQWVEFPPTVNNIICKDCFGQSEGHIVFAQHELGQLKIWTLNDCDDSSEWCLKCHASFVFSKETYPEYVIGPWHEDFIFAGFHPRNMKVLFLDVVETKLFYNVESSTMQKICSFPEQGWELDYDLLPYTYGLIGPHLFLCD